MDIIRIFVPEACEQEASPVGCGGPVPIGYVGESGVRQVVLDFSPWVETYGPGALTLMVRRNGDADAYPVTLEIDGSTAAWTVSNVDTHIYGVGRAQYMYVVDGENVKSVIFQTFVDKSVTQPGSDPPDPYEGWVQHLTELGAETIANAQAAAESAEAALAAKTAAETAQAAAAGSASDAAAAKTAAETAQASAAGSATAAAGSASDAAAAKTAAETAQGAAETAAQSVSQSAAQIETNRQDISDLKNAKAPVIIDTASGAIAHFEDGADGMPIKTLTVNIEPVQTGSGDPSPQNVRPISGWTGASIYREAVYNPSASPIAEIPFPTPPGTVYGGMLDVTSGVLTVTKTITVLDGSADENWYEISSGLFESDDCLPDTYNINSEVDWICNKYKIGGSVTNSTGAANAEDKTIFNQKGSSGSRRWDRIWIKDTSLTTLEDFTTSLSTTPVQLVYSLPESLTYQLTPAEVKTLLGQNNIWADTGDVSVEYPADTKLYIQKVNKPTDDDMTADSQIASGKYFIIGNNLYLSTTVIPAGDTIIPGTNCQKTDLAAALNALNT